MYPGPFSNCRGKRKILRDEDDRGKKGTNEECYKIVTENNCEKRIIMGRGRGWLVVRNWSQETVVR